MPVACERVQAFVEAHLPRRRVVVLDQGPRVVDQNLLRHTAKMLECRLLDGEKMAAVARTSMSRAKTGYKILKRYNDVGLEGLTDRSRRPYRHANQLPVQIDADRVMQAGQVGNKRGSCC